MSEPALNSTSQMNVGRGNSLLTPELPYAQPTRTANVGELLAAFDARIVQLMAEHGVLITRVALGAVFFWFGVLKFFPGLSVAEGLATKTIFKLSLGHVYPSVSLPVLATWECLIGLGLISGRFLRVTLALLFLQLLGTFLPLVFFPSETWIRFPYVPTLEGQYIIKNWVLLSAGLIVGATMRGGRIIADPKAADGAAKKETSYARHRRRFRRDP